MVRVFISNIRDLPDALDNPKVLEGLPDERKDKIKRIKIAHGRKQSLGAGLLLKHAQNAYGEDISYNLSHSGDYVICATSNTAVGCDIEKVKNAPIKVARRYFCENEVLYIDKVPEDSRSEEFFRLWTIKESFVKMLKKGLAMGLDSFEVSFDEGISIKKNDEKVACHIKEYKLEGYKISVCAEEEFFAGEMDIIEL
ncbi:MAG: 4'-phosphopantetheinyl transferase superfamily protein [Firmicutes bacterium]|nr:4'-phosphopantetheinyl transferase superfamily protein [Bacillota bacterium]